jgi:hypothetical protein
MAKNSEGCVEFCAGCKAGGSFLGTLDEETTAKTEFFNLQGGNRTLTPYVSFMDEDGGKTEAIDTGIIVSADTSHEQLQSWADAMGTQIPSLIKRVSSCNGMRAIGCPALAKDVTKELFRDVKPEAQA